MQSRNNKWVNPAIYIDISVQMDEVKEKDRTYYFFVDNFNIKDRDPDIIKLDQKSYKIILILHEVIYITYFM